MAVFSSQIVEVAMSKRDQTLKLAILQHFFHQRAVQRVLACRVQKQAKERLAAITPLAVEDVSAPSLLSLVSEPDDWDVPMNMSYIIARLDGLFMEVLGVAVTFPNAIYPDLSISCRY